jgi:hypothetical protein
MGRTTHYSVVIFVLCDHNAMETLDLQILQRAAVHGTIYPKSEHEKQRIPILVERGYLRIVHPPSSGTAPVPFGYELTMQGSDAVEEARHPDR